MRFFSHYFQITKIKIKRKERKIMAEQQRQSLCPRLIDYLAIVGARVNSVPRAGVGNTPPVVVSFFLLQNSVKFF